MYSTIAGTGGTEGDEQVNIGYGTTSKKNLTTSVSSLKINKNEIQTYSNIYDYLRGRVPGLNVVGQGSETKIIIRGISTIYAGTDPLILVDGVQTTDISWVRPADVTNVEVLKDAASCAMYGVQGANGVILITTRKK